MTSDSALILVTGSNGVIGPGVMRRFRGRIGQVAGFDRKVPEPAPPGCTCLAVEMTSEESVREGLRVLRKHRGSWIAPVVHLVGCYDLVGAPSPKYKEITAREIDRLLRGLWQAGFQVEQLVSSTAMLVHATGEPGAGGRQYDELQHTLSRLLHGKPLETIVLPSPPAKLGVWLMDLVFSHMKFSEPWMIDQAPDHGPLDLTQARTQLEWAPTWSVRWTLPRMVSARKEQQSFQRSLSIDAIADLLDFDDVALACGASTV